VRAVVFSRLEGYETFGRASHMGALPPSAYGCDSARAEAIIAASDTTDSLTYEQSGVGVVINREPPIHIGDDACVVILGRGMPLTSDDKQRVTTANGVTEVWYLDVERKTAFWFRLDGRRWILTSIVE